MKPTQVRDSWTSPLPKMMPSLWHVSLKLPGSISYTLHFFKGKMQQHSKEFSTTVLGALSLIILQYMNMSDMSTQYLLISVPLWVIF